MTTSDTTDSWLRAWSDSPDHHREFTLDGKGKFLQNLFKNCLNPVMVATSSPLILPTMTMAIEGQQIVLQVTGIVITSDPERSRLTISAELTTDSHPWWFHLVCDPRQGGSQLIGTIVCLGNTEVTPDDQAPTAA